MDSWLQVTETQLSGDFSTKGNSLAPHLRRPGMGCDLRCDQVQVLTRWHQDWMALFISHQCPPLCWLHFLMGCPLLVVGWLPAAPCLPSLLTIPEEVFMKLNKPALVSDLPWTSNIQGGVMHWLEAHDRVLILRGTWRSATSDLMDWEWDRGFPKEM